MSEPAPVEILDADTPTELAPYEPPPAPNLFSPDPEQALKRMAELATPLADVIEAKKLYATINGRRHVTCDGWMTLGGMLGVVPVVTWTRQLEDRTGWEARVEARTLDGRVVGAAESMCSRSESTWKRRDDFALRSMAQTRAISRALRAPLGQIVQLAGYETTGAEEMPSDGEEPSMDSERRGPAAPVAATESQREQIRALIRTLEGANRAIDWRACAREYAGVPPRALTRTGAKMLIEKLQADLMELTSKAGEGK